MAETTRTNILPASRQHWLDLRSRDVTSTESSALFDMNPRLTRLELFYRKQEELTDEIPDNERMRWGRRLEESIARGIAEDHGVEVVPMREYQRLPDCRMGASFDFRIVGTIQGTDDALKLAALEYGCPGLFEIKNVDYLIWRDQWIHHSDGTHEAPDHIEVQVQHQLHVAGLEWAAIGVLVSGNRPQVLIRKRDVQIGKAIEARIRDLWQMIHNRTPPEAVWPADAAFVCNLYQHAEPGKVLDAREDPGCLELARRYKGLSEAKSRLDQAMRVYRARLLTRIGEHEKVILDGFTISAGVVGPAHVEYERKAYRNFNVYRKKKKTGKPAA